MRLYRDVWHVEIHVFHLTFLGIYHALSCRCKRGSCEEISSVMDKGGKLFKKECNEDGNYDRFRFEEKEKACSHEYSGD